MQATTGSTPGWGTWGFKATPVSGKYHGPDDRQTRRRAGRSSIPSDWSVSATFDLANEMGATAASH